jgi:excisionase family DNA binding protein
LGNTVGSRWNGIGLSISANALDELIQLVIQRLAEALDDRDGTARGWPAFMSIETAASYLDVSVERIRKLKERQEIPFIQEAPGHRVLFARGDLDAWMASMRHGPWDGGA